LAALYLFSTAANSMSRVPQNDSDDSDDSDEDDELPTSNDDEVSCLFYAITTLYIIIL